MDIEMYLGMQDMDREDLREQIRPQAEKRITRGLLLGKIADEEDLDIDPDDVTSTYQEILENNFGPEDSEAREAFMNSRESMSLLNQLSSQMISQRTLEFLKALAKGEDTSQFRKSEEGEEDESGEENSETPADEESGEDSEKEEQEAEEIQDQEEINDGN
jgi:trigger factor